MKIDFLIVILAMLLVLPEATRANVQYCYLDIYVKDSYNNPLVANIYIDGSYFAYSLNAYKKVEIGSHIVSVTKPGYTSDLKSVSCSCGETKRVDLILIPIKTCTPGEVRNRYCDCPTQVTYEKCKSDGSGWERVTENCVPGYICKDGYCVLEKDGWYDTGEERCNLAGLECGAGTKEKEQEYRDYTCIGATCIYVVTQKKWINIGTCYQDCNPGYVYQSGYYTKTITTRPPSNCESKYLNEFRCSGSWLQRKYLYSDCSTSWVDWEYCSYGCLNGRCSPRLEESCKISFDVDVPDGALIGDIITTTIKIKNFGDIDNYVSFDAYVCKTDHYCIPMNCEGSVDPTVYISAYSTRSLTCTARVQKAGDYKIKISYNGCEKSGVIYSGVFSIKEKEARCAAKFFDEFKCNGNWKLQLYQYSDCSTSWVHVEYCKYGCSNGACLSEITTTTLSYEEKEEFIPTSQLVLPRVTWAVIIILIVFLIALTILWGLRKKKLWNRSKPEWFDEDC
ncbi:MAG: hypothetical protein QW423_00620 [Candidatus Aenigmatarchaeota archaeon]